MAKYGFYGVYGLNGGGVYDNWEKVISSKKYVKGFNVKKFSSLDNAVKYVEEGVAQVMENVNVDKLYTRMNWFFLLETLYDERQHVKAQEALVERIPFFLKRKI